MEMVQFNASNIDERGLLDGVSEIQLDIMADQINTLEGLLPLVKGDMFVQKCAHLGIKGMPMIEELEKIRIFSDLVEFASKLNLKVSSLREYAVVAQRWTRGNRVEGMVIQHYRVLDRFKLEGEEARQYLLKAQNGYPGVDGKVSKVHTSTWLANTVKKDRGDTTADNKLVAEDTQNAAINSVMPGVTKDIKKLKLPPKTEASVLKKIERTATNDSKKLQAEFSDAVDAQVEKNLKKEKAKLAKIRTEQLEQKAWNEKMRDGIKTTITAAEFKSLRQFCHPDKHPEREAQARKAYDIVEKIGDKLGFVK